MLYFEKIFYENVRRMSTSMLSIIEIAQEILSKDEPLHYCDIAKRAMVLYPEIGQDVEQVSKKFSSSLSGHVSRNANKKTAIFRRISNGKNGHKAGIYGLKKKKSKPIASPPKKPDSPASTSFFGKAGEYGVFSELLFWGYNPAMTVVDHGIDIIAFKGNDYFNIQVKARNPKDKGASFSFSIDTKVFERHDNSKTFYVFVVRREVKGRQLSEYVIMPSHEISRLISLNHIKADNSISIKISIQGNSFMINNKYELANINDFSIIK